MLNLVSDPTTAPILSASLARDDMSGASIRPQITYRDKDVTMPRTDGTELVIERVPLQVLNLRAVQITRAQARALRTLRDAGRAIYAFPNFDADTELWAPLTGTTKALKRNHTARTLEEDSGTFTRASTSYHYNPVTGLIESTAAGSPRFRESNLGQGIILDRGNDNLVTGHPSSGSPLWSDILTTATVSWDSGVLSPVTSEGGSVRVDLDKADAAAILRSSSDYTKGATAERLQFVIWMRGKGRIKPGVAGSVTGIIGEFTVDLTGDWTPYRITVDAPATAEDVIPQVTVLDQSQTVRAWIGPMHLTLEEGAYQNCEHEWLPDGSTTAEDELRYTIDDHAEDVTVSVCGLLPSFDEYAYFCLLQASTFMFQFPNAGDRTFRFAGGGTTATLTLDDGAADGQPFYAAMRIKPRDAAANDSEARVTGYYHDPVNGYQTVQSVGIADDNVAASRVDFEGWADYHPTQSMPQHFRLDRRAWSDAEMALHRRIFTNEELRRLVTLTQGRRYRYVSDTLQPEIGSERFSGDVTLVELERDDDWILSA